MSRTDIAIALLTACTVCLGYIAWAAEKALDYLHEIVAGMRDRED